MERDYTFRQVYIYYARVSLVVQSGEMNYSNNSVDC